MAKALPSIHERLRADFISLDIDFGFPLHPVFSAFPEQKIPLDPSL
jgi:hypothetical protein